MIKGGSSLVAASAAVAPPAPGPGRPPAPALPRSLASASPSLPPARPPGSPPAGRSIRGGARRPPRVLCRHCVATLGRPRTTADRRTLSPPTCNTCVCVLPCNPTKIPTCNTCVCVLPCNPTEIPGKMYWSVRPTDKRQDRTYSIVAASAVASRCTAATRDGAAAPDRTRTARPTSPCRG